MLRYLAVFAMRRVILFYLLVCSGLPAKAQDIHNGVFISTIAIEGNKKTRRSIILRELPVHEAQLIAPDLMSHYLSIAKLRLLNLGLFTVADIRTFSVGKDTVQWEITVHERWSIIPTPVFQLADRNFNVWWDEKRHDPRRINAGLTITDNNFRGNLESLSATVQAGYTQRLGLAYIRPYLSGGQQHGIGFAAGVVQSGELPYATDSNKLLFAKLPGTHIIRQYDGSISWFYRPKYALRHSLTLAFHHADISDTLRQLNAEYFGNSRDRLRYMDIAYRLDYNGVDNWNYPLQGLKSVNYVIVRKGLEGLGWQAQWHTETGMFRPIKGRLYAQAIVRGRLSVPNDLPYFLQGALGTKTDYVRGYEYYVVDGTHYGVLRFDLKYALVNHIFRRPGFRYLPELPLRIYPKLFADAGMAHNPYPGNSFLHDRMLYSGGLGVDIVSAYDFKLRLEAAVNHLGQYGLYLHLNSE